MKKEKRRQKDWIGWAVLCVYSIIVIVVMFYHEPWYDEAEAWLIARDTTLYNLLLVRPHFEGHPPLWHLLLRIPAKAGFPYELSLKTIQFIFAFMMVWLIEFRSPFNRIVRTLLPFTFFFIYQYGVIARPYALFTCAFFLMADLWKKKDACPWKMVLAMLLLCLTSAYGLALAGGIAICWVMEIWQHDRSLIQNRRRFAAHIFLLICALLLMIDIWPSHQALALEGNTIAKVAAFPGHLFLFWFFLPSETILTAFSEYALLQLQQITPAEIADAAFISAIIWMLLIVLCYHRKMLRLLFIPYVCISMVGAGMYFCTHHYGLLLMFFVFICWIAQEKEPISIKEYGTVVPKWCKKGFPEQDQQRFIRLMGVILIGMTVGINMFWSISACAADIGNDYSSSHKLISMIRQKDLTRYTWLCLWKESQDADSGVFCMDTNLGDEMNVLVNPYLKKSLAYNTKTTYITHQQASAAENNANILAWKKHAAPDFILYGNTKYFDRMRKQLGITDTYVQMNIGKTRKVWKADMHYYTEFIWVKKSIYYALFDNKKR